MGQRLQFTAPLAAMLLTMAACGSSGGASVSLVEPVDGSTIAGGVSVSMAADGITIEEAGEARDGAGHFHVIADAGCTAKGDAIGKDADHVHFGKGQADGVIYLAPGEHDLCLEAGDGTHTALGISETRKITVAITDQEQWCAVIAEVDDLFNAVDALPDDLDQYKLAFENIHRLGEQLADGVDVLDAEASDEVDQAIEFEMAYASAILNAGDQASAEAAIEQIFSEFTDGDIGGSAWIAAECGVEI